MDRYSRFAKVGGEMISLGSVEEKLSQVFDEENQFVAVALSDDKKARALCFLIKSALSLDEINERIKGLNVPPIMLPSQIFLVDEIRCLEVVIVDLKVRRTWR